MDQGTSFDEAKARVGTLPISALLAAAGGFLDSFTYVGHGHVFANAMTGNVVLLGISYLYGPTSGATYSPLRHLPPIVAFLLGTFVAQAVQFHPKQRHVAPPYLGVLWFEIAILFGLSLLPPSTNDLLITTTVAFTASVQVATFREVNGRSFNSTFTTGNLRTLGEAAFSWLFEEHSEQSIRVTRDFAVICCLFLLGATTGGYATHTLGNRALWVDIVFFILIAILVQRSGRRNRPVQANTVS